MEFFYFNMIKELIKIKNLRFLYLFNNFLKLKTEDFSDFRLFN